MCSISGAITSRCLDHNFLIDVISKSSLRGKDSFGVVSIDTQNSSTLLKKIESAKDHPELKGFLTSNVKIVLNNNRAEPTTEYVEKKTENDIQPFSNVDKSIFVVHNGTIANDKELVDQHGLEPKTEIDSAVIPLLLEKLWDGKSELLLSQILMHDLIGSYALGIWDKRSPNKLWLATNYKPLYIMRTGSSRLYFSSLPEFLEDGDVRLVEEIKPYTLMKVELDMYGISTSTYSLYKVDHELERKKKALIVASGGMDSTVAAAWAIQQGHEITLLHFKYKCRAEEAEVRAVHQLKDYFGCELVEIPVDFFKNTIKHSRLTNPEEAGELVKDRGGVCSAELAWEWVPARNLIFLSIAAGYAEANDLDYLILGGNLEESGAYPDNEYIFQKKFNDILPNSLNLQKKLELLTPIAHMMKHEIVKLGLEVNAPMDLSWSCYENGEVHCGQCGPCFMRKTAFKMNKEKDSIKYLSEERDNAQKEETK